MSAVERRQALMRLLVQQTGPVTTGMVWHYYRENRLAPGCRTAARDLQIFERRGLLRATGPDNDRSYWLVTYPSTRREWLLVAAQVEGQPVTTHRAEQLLAGSPFSCHRNSARKSLRSLAAVGAMTPGIRADGRPTYAPTAIDTERSAA